MKALSSEQEKMRVNLEQAQDDAEELNVRNDQLRQQLHEQTTACERAQEEARKQGERLDAAVSSSDAGSRELRVKLADAEARAIASDSAAIELARERDAERAEKNAAQQEVSELSARVTALVEAAREQQTSREEEREDALAQLQRQQQELEQHVKESAAALATEQTERRRTMEQMEAEKAELQQQKQQLQLALDATQGDAEQQLAKLHEWEARREDDARKLAAAENAQAELAVELNAQLELKQAAEEAAQSALQRAQDAEAERTCAEAEARSARKALDDVRSKAEFTFGKSDSIIANYGTALKERDEAVGREKLLREANSKLAAENARINDENAVLAGHKNNAQRIKYCERLRDENRQFGEERKDLNKRLRRLEVVLAHERITHRVGGAKVEADSENMSRRANRVADTTTDAEVERAEQQMKLGEMAELKEQEVVRLQKQLEELRSAKELRLQLAELVAELRLSA
eukprot:g28.t1